MKKVIFSGISLLLTVVSFAQSPNWIIVDKITITGNEKTKVSVIFRELPFQLGDTILLSKLTEKLTEGERQLMNSGLFASATIAYKDWEGATQKVHLQIDVLENWYIYPIPKFELADRNFNVWWKEQNRSLERVNIGLEFKHLNLTGWGDEFEIGFEYGYTRSYSISYKRPYLNKAKTLGLETSLSFSRNREINYATENNKQLFFNLEDDFARRQSKLQASLNWRPVLYVRHGLLLEYHQNWIDPIVSSEFNPDYFTNHRNEQQFIRLGYTFRADYRDNRAYPWSGYAYGGDLLKDGLGFFADRNALTLEAFLEKYWPIGEKLSASIGVRSKYTLTRQPQDYPYNRAMGFGRNKMSGYELFLIDGLDMVLFRSNLRIQLLKGKFNFGKWVFIESFRHFPFQINASFSNDFGYVNAPFDRGNNSLSNRALWGGGVGFDFVFYYDFVFRIQYSVNELGQTGIFLDFDLGI
jgi:outer membrane protein assembly factor BamA